MIAYNTRKNVPVILFSASISLFILSQLVINAVLNPLGTELQRLNSEKNFLIEENNIMQENVAQLSSITAVKKLADQQLSLTNENPKTIVYLGQSNVLAEK
jgi:hypothetical protein